MKKTLFLLAVGLFLNRIEAQISPEKLICSFSFDAKIKDNSRNNYMPFLNGASFTFTTDRFGNYQKAVHFDGISNYIDLSPNNIRSFQNPTPKSVSMWIRNTQDKPQALFYIASTLANVPTEAVAATFIGQGATSLVPNVLVGVSNRGAATNLYTHGISTRTRQAIFDNNWHHLVFVFDNIVTKIYLDGQLMSLIGDGKNDGFWGNSVYVNQLTIGARFSQGSMGAYFEGDMDDFMIIDQAISPKMVQDLYNFNNFLAVKNKAANQPPLDESITDSEDLEELSNLEMGYSIQFSIYRKTNDLHIETSGNCNNFTITFLDENRKKLFSQLLYQSQLAIKSTFLKPNKKYFMLVTNAKGNIVEEKIFTWTE